MAPKTVFITGANRGIGLGLVKQLLEQIEIQTVIATARNVDSATDLKAITDPRLHILSLDVTDDQSIKNAYEQVRTIVGETGLNLLINNAGALIPYEIDGAVDRSAVAKQFDVNATANLVITQIFLPLLIQAAKSSPGDDLSTDRAALVNISSTGGSVSLIDGTFPGPLVIYRMSKAALNSFAKAASVDLRKYNILVASFCPGWVKTDMGGENAQLTVTVKQSG